MNTPEYYTESEGGNWERFDPEEGWHPLDMRLLNQRSTHSVIIKGFKVHALAFDNPACGYGNFLRWDCVSGFNN